MKLFDMKTTIIATSTSVGFICAYFLNLTLENAEQYLAVVAVMLLDGFFGVIKGIKTEGFQTRKALKVLQTIFTWIIILTYILMIERGFPGTGWLSETIITPFIVFQLLSALKNASLAGFIQNELLNEILDRFDKHKGKRK
jgi:phage-related holin